MAYKYMLAFTMALLGLTATVTASSPAEDSERLMARAMIPTTIRTTPTETFPVITVTAFLDPASQYLTGSLVDIAYSSTTVVIPLPCTPTAGTQCPDSVISGTFVFDSTQIQQTITVSTKPLGIEFLTCRFSGTTEAACRQSTLIDACLQPNGVYSCSSGWNTRRASLIGQITFSDTSLLGAQPIIITSGATSDIPTTTTTSTTTTTPGNGAAAETLAPGIMALGIVGLVAVLL